MKSDIYDLKDVYTRYTSYGKFLEKISPEDWRSEKVGERKKNNIILFKFQNRRSRTTEAPDPEILVCIFPVF